MTNDECREHHIWELVIRHSSLVIRHSFLACPHTRDGLLAILAFALAEVHAIDGIADALDHNAPASGAVSVFGGMTRNVAYIDIVEAFAVGNGFSSFESSTASEADSSKGTGDGSARSAEGHQGPAQISPTAPVP